MAELCSCDTGVNGFGVIDCYGAADRIVGLGFVALKDGTIENIISAPVSQSDWEGLLFEKDGGKRVSLLSDVKAYTSERDDAVTETIDTIDYFISEGKKMVSFQVIGSPYKLKEYVDSLRCQKSGFWGVSASSQLLGRKKTSGGADELYPIPVQTGTINSKMIDKTKEALAKMQVTFQIDENFNDADLVYIPSDEITADLFDTEAMIQATAVTTGTTTTLALTQEIQLNFSLSGQISANGQEPLEGFDNAAYFEIYNETASAAVLVTGASESSTVKGLYTISWAILQTTADVLKFSASSTAPFNFTAFTKTAL
jgi:hypothetical protein